MFMALSAGKTFFLWILKVAGWIVGAACILFTVLLIAIIMIAIFVDYQLKRRLAYGGGDPNQYRRAKRGLGMDVDELARRLDLNVQKLKIFKPRYREVHIPKRSGGTRKLWVPNPQTKSIQRRILRKLLAKLRAHDAAYGFEKGRSIVHNALPHRGQRVVIRMDIVDFFPSTRIERIDWYFRRIGWNAEAAAILTELTTWQGGLPQGAPTSPRLSNLVNFYLDVQLENFAQSRKGQYTRYADDITFSFPKDYPRKVRGTIQKTALLLKHKGYQLHLRKKLHIRRRHQRQIVTGLIVNDTVALPRRTRRWLRAVEHHLATGRQATLSEAQLQGWRALQEMVKKQTQAAATED